MSSAHLDDLAGQTVLVTGGSRGLGKAMVTEFARRGANVVIASRKLDNCKELAAEITDRFHVTATPVAANVSDWDQCTHLVDEVYALVGPVDILINNAGLSPLYPSLAEVSEALWDKVIGVNLKGPFRLSALVGSKMIEAGAGVIINISSVASVRPTPATAPYAAAKAGLNTLTAAFAQAFAPTVRVNGIVCGHFLTDVSAAWDMAEFEQRAQDHILLQRAAGPDEIIGAAIFLASSESSYCTGSLLTVDGGMH